MCSRHVFCDRGRVYRAHVRDLLRWDLLCTRRKKLHGLEEQYVGTKKPESSEQLPQSSLFPESRPEEQAVVARLKAFSADETSPREALNILYELNRMLGRKPAKK